MRPGPARLVLTGLLAAAAGGGAAQTSAPDVTGRWCFQTEDYVSISTCSMSGELEIMPADEDGVHACTLQTEERCAALDEAFRARQACVASRDGDTLRIDSVVLSYEPDWGFYTPDNFSLRVENGARMTGAMQSPENPQGPENAGVTFGRCEALVS